ncbi:hypothetical protein PoB_001855300 [Plakobranchus ocellatus]|uniref:Uncharacterized protein n=1 Tax=Plakobranchus ocellatus TaxID=259542 RepID=A0AAV3ZCA5_9GAST|nr:hypothetical protein PoB_001855300 [Plakobranchus ocellatus]
MIQTIISSLQVARAMWAPGLTIGVCSGIMCVLTHFLPDTAGRELPQTISQLQAWFTTKDVLLTDVDEKNPAELNKKDCKVPPNGV